MLCAKFGWGFGEEDIYLTVEKGLALHLNQRCFVPSLFESEPMVLEKKIFLKSTMYFQYYLPL